MNGRATVTERAFAALCRRTAWILFGIALLTYWLTTEPSASYWDCPEYIAVGSRLEIGHPPGNPTWALAARIASLFAPGASFAALAVNLTSGFFTAFAVYFLALLIFRYAAVALKCFGDGEDLCERWKCVAVIASGVVGSLSFAWCDSAWFSAVEAEVYAFSIFCTAAILHFMYRWSDTLGQAGSGRYIVLVAYLTGLSIGVHQLTLLCIPALALIYLFRRRGNIRKRRLVATLLVSFALVALVLYGLMPGMVAMAQRFELFFVNRCGMGYHSGVIFYVALFVAVAIATLVVFYNGWSRRAGSLSAALLVWMSGIFGASEQFVLSTVISIVCGATVFYLWRRKRNALYVSVWCFTMLVTGYSTYALILVRGAASPPMNQSAPSDIFAFSSYLGRDQYGKKPLIYGRTLRSTALRRERGSAASGFTYTEPFRDKRKPVYAPYTKGATAVDRSGFVTAADTAENSLIAGRRHGYMLTDYRYSYRYPPELDMWFPRMLSGDPDDLEAYGAWSGMSAGNMVHVRASEAVDSAGNAVGKFDPATGHREKAESSKPSYLHNFIYMATYQIGYMYFRYLLWNFSGRQNDMHSTGEGEHGNFITGIPWIDNAMLGDQSLIPTRDGLGNPGRNCYFMLPFLLGIAGMVWQYRSGRRSRRNAMALTMLFVMTGIAIVLYLNQDPGEPRERDYSFIGSFYAFTVWIGLGAAWLCACVARLWKKKRLPAVCAVSVVAAGVPLLMLAENADDHDRSGRYAVVDFAADILLPLERNAILFVNGDNYTFPLWYAQEVEGIRRDVRVVSLAYLTAPWYPPQLMTDAYGSEGLPFTAKTEDVKYGHYALTYIRREDVAPKSDARKVLSDLYAARNRKPELSHSVLRIPAQSGDSMLLDLRKMIPGGKKYLTQGQLMMLDIVTTNAYLKNPRPVYWLSALQPYHQMGFDRLTEECGPVARLYYGSRPERRETVMRQYRDIVDKYRWGGLGEKNIYADETVRSQARYVRKHVLQTATALTGYGEYGKALVLAGLIERKMPDRAVPFITLTHRYVPYHEALDLADIYLAAASYFGNDGLRLHALGIICRELDRLSGWRSFYDSLSPSKKDVMSPQVMLESSELYAAIEAWNRAGGKRERIDALRRKHGLDLDSERRMWHKSKALREMLRESRYGSADSDSVIKALHKEFSINGGEDSELLKYGELKDMGL